MVLEFYPVPDDPGSDPVGVGQPYSGVFRPQRPGVDLPKLAFLTSIVHEKIG